MFITFQDKHNFISFVGGYEMGSETCDFTEPLENFISENYGTQVNNSRWIGHIEQLSKKLSMSWTSTFKKVTLEFLGNNETEEFVLGLHKNLKTRIESLITRIKKDGDPWFNSSWSEDWLCLCLVEKTWFKAL